MSERIHCDLCDAIIPTDDERLSMRAWIQKEEDNAIDADNLDICRKCITANESLETIWSNLVRRRISEQAKRAEQPVRKRP